MRSDLLPERHGVPEITMALSEWASARAPKNHVRGEHEHDDAHIACTSGTDAINQRQRQATYVVHS
jgi:hypothetical protein